MKFDPKNPYQHIDKPKAYEPIIPPIKSWSVSAKQAFRRCPYSLYLQRVKKLKRKSNKFADKGIKIHEAIEH